MCRTLSPVSVVFGKFIVDKYWLSQKKESKNDVPYRLQYSRNSKQLHDFGILLENNDAALCQLLSLSLPTKGMEVK